MKRFYILVALIASLAFNVNAQLWTSVALPNITTPARDMTVANGRLYVVGETGVYYTTDATNWTSSSTGILSTTGNQEAHTIIIDNSTMYCGAKGKLYKSTDYGANWTMMSVSSAFSDTICTTIYASGDTIITGWSKAYVGNMGILKVSTDGGQTWSRKTFSGAIEREIVMYAGVVYIPTKMGLYKSTDMCSTFTLIAGGLPTFVAPVTTYLVESNGVLVFSGYIKGTYISSDAGVTWTKKDAASGLTSTYGGKMLAHNGYVFLTTLLGPFQSADNGSTWTSIKGTGVSVSSYVSTEFFKGKIYVSLLNGTLATTDVSASVKNNYQNMPTLDIYPNPVQNNSLTISHKGSYDIEICSLEGKLSLKKSGLNGIQTIDVSRLNSGVYFIKAINRRGVSMVKFILK